MPLLLAKLLCGLKLFCQNTPNLALCDPQIFETLPAISRVVLKFVNGALFDPMFGLLAKLPPPNWNCGGRSSCTGSLKSNGMPVRLRSVRLKFGLAGRMSIEL